ncbi:phospho-N-acetylmuramoyl-pentapeptide-transferase [Tannockella kyphosi]|uniref:phospho-N-acetylmuramoyl-pentapeptide- transferase n=1 Tax=Tannockella kyphosi TaxID=2899121 RepID=UPI0020116714|nr:phospho-N-acetylmuramoyl-pentapeptide-transferase [Tannockella kyphosi]
MEYFINLLASFIISFLVVLVAMPKVIPFLHKMKFGQVQREEGMESHKAKGGTPTMGGSVFILSTLLVACILNYKDITNPILLLLCFVTLGFGLIGLLDDALIVVKKKNDGLSAKMKYALQSLIAIAFYFLAKEYVPGFDTIISIPFFHINVDLGYAYPVLVYFMFTATSNGVNLSDGLDGLATGLCMMAISPFIIFAIMMKEFTVASFAMCMVGSLLGFMMFNYNPAKIFMGDVGSLSLGGLLSALAILTNQEILLVLIGGVFVMETLSVIIQVVSFKTRGKRVFKMAPIHHHFEMLGWNEPQVVISFWFMGFICALIGMVLGVL